MKCRSEILGKLIQLEHGPLGECVEHHEGADAISAAIAALRWVLYEEEDPVVIDSSWRSCRIHGTEGEKP